MLEHVYFSVATSNRKYPSEKIIMLNIRSILSNCSALNQWHTHAHLSVDINIEMSHEDLQHTNVPLGYTVSKQ